MITIGDWVLETDCLPAIKCQVQDISTWAKVNGHHASEEKCFLLRANGSGERWIGEPFVKKISTEEVAA